MALKVLLLYMCVTSTYSRYIMGPLNSDDTAEDKRFKRNTYRCPAGTGDRECARLRQVYKLFADNGIFNQTGSPPTQSVKNRLAFQRASPPIFSTSSSTTHFRSIFLKCVDLPDHHRMDCNIRTEDVPKLASMVQRASWAKLFFDILPPCPQNSASNTRCRDASSTIPSEDFIITALLKKENPSTVMGRLVSATVEAQENRTVSFDIQMMLPQLSTGDITISLQAKTVDGRSLNVRPPIFYSGESDDPSSYQDPMLFLVLQDNSHPFFGA